MCAQETPVDAVRTTEEKLRLLLVTENTARSTAPPDIAGTSEALQALRARLGRARGLRARIGMLEREKNEERVVRVEMGIIAAKVEAGEVLGARDGLRRDVARARRALEVDRDPGVGGTNGGESEEEGEEGCIILEKRAAAEIARLRVVEQELLSVTEEIDAIRKRRAELQKKVLEAQEEW